MPATLGVLRQVQRHVPEKVQNLLEFESSVNDLSADSVQHRRKSFTVGAQGQALPDMSSAPSPAAAKDGFRGPGGLAATSPADD